MTNIAYLFAIRLVADWWTGKSTNGPMPQDLIYWEPYPVRDQWDGTDEAIVGLDCCHHGIGFDEFCPDCVWESEESNDV